MKKTHKRQKNLADRYKGVINLLIDFDIKKIISEMIDMRDQKEVFFDKSKAEDILMRNLSNYDEVSNMVNILAEKEEKEWRVFLDNTSELYLDKFEHYDDSVRKRNISQRIEDIYVNMLNQIQAKAEIERGNKVHLRKEDGSSIDFVDCDNVVPFKNYVEFYKDGGWGVATSDGKVVISNILLIQPSKSATCLSINPCLKVVQCIDNNKFGIISLQSFETVLPLEYDRVAEFGSFYEQPQYPLIKVNNENGWGCVNEKGIQKIECKYDEIELVDDCVECYRGGYYVKDESFCESGRTVYYDGKRDLYDKEGSLLIGGYSMREHYLSEIYYYYFGTSYEDYYAKESDWMNNEVELLKYRINYDNSFCLIMDGNLKTVVKSDGKCFQFPRGKCIESIQELISIVPKQFLFHNEVRFWGGHFMFQKQRLGEKTVVQETRTIKTYQPHTRPATKEEKALSLLFDEKEIEEVKEDYVYSEVTKDVLKEDDRIIITGLSKENDLLWSSCVNELGKLNGLWLLAYRIGDRVGFYSEKGLGEAKYVAISYKDGVYYVAQIEFKDQIDATSSNNQNYIGEFIFSERNEDGDEFTYNQYGFLKFYKFVNGELDEINDDRNKFNPAKLNWFPNTFKDTYHIYDEDEGLYDDGKRSGGYEWTDEDAWDAMTDGMYGDYPGSGWDSEWFGY